MRGLASQGTGVISTDIKDCEGSVEASEAEVLCVNYMTHQCDVADEASVWGMVDSVTG